MDIEEAIPAEEFEHHEMRPFAGVEPSTSGVVHGSFLSSISTASCRISYTSNSKLFLYGLIGITCIPLVAGCAFASIFIEHENVIGAVSAFFAAAMSLGTLSLFLLHLLRKLESAHDKNTLNGLKILAMLVSVASGILLGVYTILAFLNKQAYSVYNINYFSAAVFSGLCLATSIQLYITAQWYQNALIASMPPQSFQMPQRY